MELAKILLNSEAHALEFIEKEGMEHIYRLIIDSSDYVSPHIKLLGLEVLNKCLSYKVGCERFLYFDVSAIYGSKPIVLVPASEKEKEKDRDRDREKEDRLSKSAKDKDKKKKKDKKKGKSRSSSDSRSPAK